MKHISLLFVLSAYFGVGDSIRCYDCNSANNTMCLDPSEYDPELRAMFLRPVECSNGVHAPNGHHNFFCRKIMQTILHKHREPEVRVTRGCGWVKHHKECYKADTEAHLETACQCFTDECNAATSITAVKALLLIVGCVSAFMFVQ